MACDHNTSPICDWDELEKTMSSHFARQKLLTALSRKSWVRRLPFARQGRAAYTLSPKP